MTVIIGNVRRVKLEQFQTTIVFLELTVLQQVDLTFLLGLN